VGVRSEGRLGEVKFNFEDAKDPDKAKKLVKHYVEFYGSGDKRITRKKLTFGPW
jgi:hypothetical protein